MKIYKTILLSAITLFCSLGSIANDCFPKKPNGLVYDETGTLNSGQINRLNNKLIQFSNSTSTQIAVVIVKELCGYSPAMYATELGQKWGVGQKEKDNGAVILVKPTGGQGQRKVHIASGYGLEGTVPDGICKRIVEKEMIPRFKSGDIYGGIDAASTVIMELASGEYPPEDYVGRRNGAGEGIAVFIFILFFFIVMIISRIGRARSYASANNMSFWMALLLMNSAMNSHRGRYSNFSSGRGSFGGFGGGGGFGGFGGGSFGGGGAGGSW